MRGQFFASHLGWLLALLVGLFLSWPVEARSATTTPKNDDVALLVLANQARANPAADGGTETAVLPMLWNASLAAAAQAHSDDMADHGCYQHNSCSGQTWYKRIGTFYPNWEWLGENIGSGSTNPKDLHSGWMHSPGHRANILSGAYNNFGAGMALGQDGFGSFPLATEDFGRQYLIALQLMPTLPAGCVLPRQAAGSEQRELLVNYYHYDGGPPQAVRAIIGSTCVNMQLAQGTATNGTYRALKAVSGSGCVPLVFEAVRSDGTRYRWPENEALLIGTSASSNCAERTTNVPTTTCGTGGTAPALPSPTPAPAPTPTPVPEPTPDPGDATVSDARVVLKPGPANASKGKVQLRLTLGAPAGFDPTASDMRVRISFGSNGEWSQTLPRMCGDSPCLSMNRRGTVASGSYGDQGPNVNFTRMKNGNWNLKLAAINQTISRLAPGPVTIDLVAGEMGASTDLMGELKDQSLFAK